MKAHELQTPTTKNKKRRGRGIGSGLGKTSGRGTKGQNSRSGGRVKPGFEGGQNPLMRRIPKVRGWTSFKRPQLFVTTKSINDLDEKIITNEVLEKHKLLQSKFRPVKVIYKGAMTKAKTVKLQKASKGAETAIKSAKGTFEQTSLPKAAKKTVQS